MAARRSGGGGRQTTADELFSKAARGTRLQIALQVLQVLRRDMITT